MKTLFTWLGKALEESPGVPSSIRLQMFLVLLFAALLPMSIWAWICIYKVALVDIPSGVVTFCSLLLGMASAAKVTQAYSESSAAPQSPAASPPTAQ